MENFLSAGICVVVRGKVRDVEERVLRGAARKAARLAGKGTRRFLLATVRTLRLIADIVVGYIEEGRCEAWEINCQLSRND